MNNKYALMGFILDEGKNTTRFQWVLDTTMCSSSNTRISVIVIKDRLRLALGKSAAAFFCVFWVFLKFWGITITFNIWTFSGQVMIILILTVLVIGGSDSKKVPVFHLNAQIDHRSP